MDQMDIDQIVDIPDTPDRLVKQGINGRNGVEVENHSSMPCHGRQRFAEEGSRDQPMIIDSGSRGLSLHPLKCTGSSSNSRNPNTSASLSLAGSSSSRNAHLFRKGVTERNPRFLSHDSMPKQSMRPPYISKSSSSSSSQNDGFLDLTESNLHRHVIGNASPSRVPGNNQADFRKRSGLANGTSSQGPTNISIAARNAGEGTNNVSRVGSSLALREEVDFVGKNNEKPGNGISISLDSISSPRVNKQKRLVRNGCISPNNIAKAKQLPGKDINGSVSVAHNNVSMASGAPPNSIDIRKLVAEDSDADTGKGKEVISHPCLSKEPDLHNKNLHSRSSMSSNEKATETNDYSRGASKSTEESGRWRSTRNRTREIDLSSSDKELYLISERDAPVYSSQHHENRLERRGKGISVASGDDHSNDPSFISSEHVRPPPVRESLSQPRARLGRLNGPRSAANSLIKRQKQGSTSSIRAECSTSVSDDPEVVFLSSTVEADNSRCSSSNVNNLQQIIEVDELSPQSRQNAHDEAARARQLEADERLARELQEQLYNEVPVFGVGEVDEHIAAALQHQGRSNPGFSRARHPISDARLMSNLHRQSQSRSSSNAPRRGSLARASTLGRMTRLRGRFPGQPRTLLPSTGRTSMFPPDMDVEMRMHILGALEDFSNMGMGSGILQADRDFNENDYELLLALDENNDHHAGASIHQINGLPQSTVQSDNFEESCAICLETPTIGDTIRHLPCLHKFHKDCIDPWLRRRTSCPVCKSSIT